MFTAQNLPPGYAYFDDDNDDDDGIHSVDDKTFLSERQTSSVRGFARRVSLSIVMFKLKPLNCYLSAKPHVEGEHALYCSRC